jgi:hypothetical protein
MIERSDAQMVTMKAGRMVVHLERMSGMMMAA